MLIWQVIFFVSLFIVFYNYAGYALIALLFNTFRKQKKQDSNHPLPDISFIVAAYNEGPEIRKKIENTISLNYPRDLVEFIFILDGSTDDSIKIVKEYPEIKLLYQPERQGKSAALNRAVQDCRNQILIFSDANTLLNPDALLNIVRHYQDPIVGGVAGEKKVISTDAISGKMVATEGLYWKYESSLKQIDSRFYSVVGAAGELFSIRKALYQPIHPSVILDDFVLSLKVADKGFRIVYEPQAVAMELPSFNMAEERKRKIRISAGSFQAIGMLSSILKFWKHPRLTYLYVSHRLLRWTLSPLALILAFVSNIILASQSDNKVYLVLLIMQIIFYGLAFFQFLMGKTGREIKIARVPYYFVFMNVSVILGFFRFLKGNQSAVWEKAKRTESEVLV